jgi:hypothetical protein
MGFDRLLEMGIILSVSRPSEPLISSLRVDKGNAPETALQLATTTIRI